MFVLAEAADEAVARHQRAEGTGIHVGARHSFRTPHLSGNVACRGGPRLGGHLREFSVEEDEPLGKLDVHALGVGCFHAREVAEPDTGLCPLGFIHVIGGILHREGERHFIIARRDDMVHGEAVVHVAVEPDLLPVRARGDELRLVAHEGMLLPVGIGGAGAAIGLEVVDFDLALRQVGASDDEPVRIAREGQRGLVLRERG